MAPRRYSPDLFSNEWDLEVRGTVLFSVEAAAVDVTSTPKQHLARAVNQVVFHEMLAFDEPERREGLTEDALHARDLPLVVAAARNLIEKVGETDVQRRHLVRVVSVEVDLLRTRRDGMLPTPKHVTPDGNFRQGRAAERIGEAHDDELEAIVCGVSEVARKKERLQRAVRILAWTNFRGD